MSGAWLLLAGARVVYFAFQRLRFPDLVPPVFIDVVMGLLLWPFALAGCWMTLCVWRRKGFVTAFTVAICGAIVVGALSRPACVVGVLLLNALYPASWHWLALLNSTRPGFVVHWVQNALEYAVVFLSSLGLSAGFVSYRELLTERRLHERAEALAKKERLHALRVRSNPHLLFNSLNSIVGLSLTSADQARTFTTQFAEFMRLTLRVGETEWHALDDELGYIGDFLRLQELRLGDAVTWHIDVDAPHNLRVPTLILQPLVENAVVHGRRHGDQPLRIEVTVSLAGSTLTLAVSNTLNPERRPDGTPGTGLGLRNLRERLAILYGSATTLDVGRVDSGHWRSVMSWPVRASDSSLGREVVAQSGSA